MLTVSFPPLLNWDVGVLLRSKRPHRARDANLKEEQFIKHIIKFLEHCKVGKVTIGEKIRIRQNCESFMIKAEEPACHFTTGFLNGFLSAVKNQHIKETKCIAVGDPHCEWEFR